MSETPNHFLERKATLVMQLLSPLHIGSGERDNGSDADVVRDFNGLPGIPGTSIQGMLRSAVAESDGELVAERIFGRTSRANQGTGRGGRLSVSWGVIHNRKNEPVKDYLTPAQRDEDEILRDAARPMLRDHVRMNGRGVAEKRGKFDERVVSAGHRFTVRLRFVTAVPKETKQDQTSGRKIDPGQESDWHILERVLRNHDLRLGGKTRRGLGAFEVWNWDETTDRDQKGLTEPGAGTAQLTSPQTEVYTLKLSPATLWMFGGGTSENADSAPVDGTRIVWDQNGGDGRVEEVWILPGSGIKGPIRHRTMFHGNRLAGNWADAEDPDAKDKAESQANVLFGCVSKKEARPGCVFIDDLFVPKAGNDPAPTQNHVAINPFTGGAKDSALFNDEPLLPAGVVPELKVRLSRSASDENFKKAKEALAAALDDLAEGRLTLGAHGGRGYGRFRGSVAKPAATDQPEPVPSEA